MKKTQGFTLLELLVCLAILVIIVSLPSPSFTFLQGNAVRAELDTLCITCRYLQRSAQARNKEQILTFDETNQSYTFQETTYHLPSTVRFGAGAGITSSPSNTHTPHNKPITFTHNKIIFYPTGITKSGTIYLQDIHGQYTYALSFPVSQVSYLRKYRYDGKWIDITQSKKPHNTCSS
jgi:prepilin-type N-terminal cleavage/methylation domain-containing protein